MATQSSKPLPYFRPKHVYTISDPAVILATLTKIYDDTEWNTVMP